MHAHLMALRPCTSVSANLQPAAQRIHEKAGFETWGLESEMSFAGSEGNSHFSIRNAVYRVAPNGRISTSMTLIPETSERERG